MVVTVTLQHIYRFPVELVFKCYNEQYGSENQIVENVRDVERKEEGGMECVKRTISFSNFFPTIFQRIKMLKTNEVLMEEECWSEPSNRRYWVRSRNLTWQDDATIAHAAYLCPDDQMKQWTKWEQESYVDFSSLGKVGTILELYMKRHIEMKMKEDIKSLENIMSSQKDFTRFL